MEYTPSNDERRKACVHEAAHAVVHSFNRFGWVYGVEIAPLGAASTWTTKNRKGATLTDLWGCCHISDNPVTLWLCWDDEQGDYTFDRGPYLEELAHLSSRGRFKRRSELRAHICGTLAGPISEGLFTGEIEPGSIGAGKYRIELDNEPHQDANIAFSSCFFLPYNNEYDHLCAVTERVLMEPEVWQCVIQIADALEIAGKLGGDELMPLLPKQRRNWPPSPRTANTWRSGRSCP